jgi:hypothetical protein
MRSFSTLSAYRSHKLRAARRIKNISYATRRCDHTFADKRRQYKPARMKLQRVLHVPGLNRRLFSVTTFAKNHGHKMTFHGDRIHVQLPSGHTANIPSSPPNTAQPIAAPTQRVHYSFENPDPEQDSPLRQEFRRAQQPVTDSRNRQERQSPNNRERSQYCASHRARPHSPHRTKRKATSTPRRRSLSSSVQQHTPGTDLDLLHDRLGHRKTAAVLAASHHKVWKDTRAVPTPDTFCTSCPAATIPRARRPRGPSSAPVRPLARVYTDTIPNPIVPGITPESSRAHMLTVVDHYSRCVWIDGMPWLTIWSTPVQ